VNEQAVIGISRTTQTNFLIWMGEEGVAVGLKIASKFLYGIQEKQIRRNIEQQSMRDYEDLSFCLPHVRTLKDKFRTARQSYPTIKGSRELCYLLVGFVR
jgi:hypothetical protein